MAFEIKCIRRRYKKRGEEWGKRGVYRRMLRCESFADPFDATRHEALGNPSQDIGAAHDDPLGRQWDAQSPPMCSLKKSGKIIIIAERQRDVGILFAWDTFPQFFTLRRSQ